MSLHSDPKPKPKIPFPRALPKRTRQFVEEAIEKHQAATEALLAFLDEADGDTDLEPSLSHNGGDGIPTGHDLEHDDSELEVSYTETHGRGGQIGSSPHDDAECSLGWSVAVNQDRALRQCGGYVSLAGEWVPANDDREAEHDGREPDENLEPSLGSKGGVDQRQWAAGGSDDLEEQCEDEGHDSDSEPEADREPRHCPAFELVQEPASC